MKDHGVARHGLEADDPSALQVRIDRHHHGLARHHLSGVDVRTGDEAQRTGLVRHRLQAEPDTAQLVSHERPMRSVAMPTGALDPGVGVEEQVFVERHGLRAHRGCGGIGDGRPEQEACERLAPSPDAVTGERGRLRGTGEALAGVERVLEDLLGCRPQQFDPHGFQQTPEHDRTLGLEQVRERCIVEWRRHSIRHRDRRYPLAWHSVPGPHAHVTRRTSSWCRTNSRLTNATGRFRGWSALRPSASGRVKPSSTATCTRPSSTSRRAS